MKRAAFLLVPVCAVLSSGTAPAQSCALELASVGPGGVQASESSGSPSITPDGRFVLFQSFAANLVPGDANGAHDLFLRDRQAASTTRVSVGTGGLEANGHCGGGSVSDDGRWVLFHSLATNLAGVADPGSFWDVFLHDRQTSTTRCLSLGLGGAPGSGDSLAGSVSGDGRFAVFFSEANDLVAGDTETRFESFVHEIATGALTRLLPGPGGTPGEAIAPRLSGDGRYVLFFSVQDDLVPGDANGAYDVFRLDRQNGAILRASVATGGGEGQSDSFSTGFSADGSVISFQSEAPDFVPNDTNGTWDVFVRDLNAGTTVRANVSSLGTENYDGDDTIASSLSPDGRYVGLATYGRGLDARGSIHDQDAYVHDLATGTTRVVSLTSGGHDADGQNDVPAIASGAGVIAFASHAAGLVPGDVNGRADVFVRTCLFPEPVGYASFCVGDGAQCPCANPAGPFGGCANQAAPAPGHGATLAAFGTASVAADTLRLVVYGTPDSALMVLVQSDALPQAPVQRGDGLLCLGGNLQRLGVRSAAGGVRAFGWGVAGDVALSVAGSVPASGAVRSYQIWYRTPNGPCGHRMNTSNGVHWNWVP